MAGLYLVAAWLFLQVAETLLPIFDTPGWVLKVLVALLVVGFIPSLAFAWIFELTPQGIKRDEEVPAEASIAPQTGRRMDRLLIIGMAVALAYFALDKFVLKPDATPAAAAVAEAPADEEVHDASIAVLPFVNMSSDPEQEFFSDGLSEELLNQLAQIPNLRVIARTSSFSFKGKDVDVATIAEALDVAHVLEGSVRRSGDTLRITAQLIRAADSSHLWSKTYDRKFEDVFKVQDEISTEVVSALKLTLLPGQGVPQTQRTGSVEAYEHYLRAAALLATGRVTDGSLATSELQLAIDLDPEYANAWAALSNAQSALAEGSQNLPERMVYIDQAKRSADKAIALAPDQADGHAARSGLRFSYDLDWTGAMADIERAVALAPNDANVLAAHAYLLSLQGRNDEAAAAITKALASNPLSVAAWEFQGQISLFAGDIDAARQAFQRAAQLEPDTNWANYYLGYLALQEGRIDEAQASFPRSDGGFPLAGESMVAFTRGDLAASDKALQALKDQFGAGFAFQVATAYAWRGDKDNAFAWLDTALTHRDAGMSRLKVDPTLPTLHDDPRFAALVQKVGFPD
jgi:TolB-like protein/tetratricopeptide (TPR) repeat protein